MFTLCQIAVTDPHPNQALSVAFFFWLQAVPALCSTIRDTVLGCCGDSCQPWSKGEKQQEEPGSHFLADVSDVKHRGRGSQKTVDIRHRHAVSHA